MGAKEKPGYGRGRIWTANFSSIKRTLYRWVTRPFVFQIYQWKSFLKSWSRRVRTFDGGSKDRCLTTWLYSRFTGFALFNASRGSGSMARILGFKPSDGGSIPSFPAVPLHCGFRQQLISGEYPARYNGEVVQWLEFWAPNLAVVVQFLPSLLNVRLSWPKVLSAVGLEPATGGLKGQCSTNWAMRPD